MNEIIEALRLSQVELAVLEGAPGEFAGLGDTHIRNGGNGGKECGQHRAAAMNVKFGDVLAGRAGGPRKPQHHRIVDRLARAVMKEPAAGPSWRRQLARQRRQHQAGASPGDADNRERAWRTAGRQCKDGVVSRMHGLFVRLKRKRQTSVSADKSSGYAALVPAAKPMMRCNKFVSVCCKKLFRRNERNAYRKLYQYLKRNYSRQQTPRQCCSSAATKPHKEKGRPKAPNDHVALQSGIHRIEELGIALRRAQLVEQEVDSVHRPHRVQ